MQGVYVNAIAAVRKAFYPCSAVVGIKDTLIEEIPIEVPSNADSNNNSNESLREESSLNEGEEEDAEPRPPPMQKVEIPILKYVSTSHPDSRSIDGWTLRYEHQGLTGRVLQTGKPLLVPHVSAEADLHFFHGRIRDPHAKIQGSYCAVPLVETATGEVYGVLAVDTLLDGRVLGQRDVECLCEIVRCMEVAREPHAKKERERKEKERLEAEKRAAEEAARIAAEQEEERKRKEQEAAEEGEGE
jgi:hypothetical protein